MDSRRTDEVTATIRAGLTRIEVLLVFFGMALLISLFWPLILSAREISRHHACQNRLRQLGVALNSYHEMHRVLPPAAVWSTEHLQSLALHKSRRIDLYVKTNWAQALLPHANEMPLASMFDTNRLTAAPENEKARNTRLPLMSCASDAYSTAENPFVFQPDRRNSVSYARGNYAINGGTHCFNDGPGSTAFLTGDHSHLEMSHSPRTFRFWGNGIAGFNVSFSYDDFTNGAASLVALEEVRAGVHAIDPRGVWALGHIGGSVTWAHGVNGDAYGPNSQHPKSDDLLNGTKLHQTLGSEFLKTERIPCVSYIDLNYQAASRSAHNGGVNILMVDGSARFVTDHIDPGLWHVMHSRETPRELLNGNLDETIAASMTTEDGENDDREGQKPSPMDQAAIENSIGMRFVKIPAGTFEMGLADKGNTHELPEESPQHQVSISRAFYLGRHEVTRLQFDQIMGQSQKSSATNDTELPEEADLPMTDITWHEAEEFCRRLSAMEEESSASRSYRLPTEAEWEYACRSGELSRYDFMSARRPNDVSGDAAGINPPLPLSPVGSYPANAFGLYDMRGNAWEWCKDWFDRDYYSRSPGQDPLGPKHGYFKVVRGSSWTFVGEFCKLSYPTMPPWKSSPFVGFRIVCEYRTPKNAPN
ncbi:MAG: SUMF1/EgtB/PvdO family nonheme iron enzyme [Planctomycetales bacterium]|nr:SUMF1/EgtB/PvdO family nonheme iron enzyme [Planctomycetales bacterium]